MKWNELNNYEKVGVIAFSPIWIPFVGFVLVIVLIIHCCFTAGDLIFTWLGIE